MLAGFKTFVLRGNVIDLAVGLVIGAAFTAVVSGLMDGIITPLIAAIFGEPDITRVGNFTLNGAAFSIGLFLNAVLNFLLVASALYFVIVMPMNKLNERRQRVDDTVAEEPAADLALLTEIRDLLAAQSRQP
ncbi:large-conductance mechanosensitive channel protein MscL [Isoptericola halotolerans]|uniref:Large-conductance mechanosensitive channel n=1 Tax=Isoptericola halotolerans TaxID=300560 RepID=A0ABX2A3S4_9MICO|nr:large conductance mechanosensitive channel protein MscL [Isoptericola halotolerans]NOV97380.1 large conductance mechanosensitive channel [Isoptericola halotolerans]